MRDIPVGGGRAIRVSASNYRGSERLDVRLCYEAQPGDPESCQPTRKGVNMPIELLPQLLAALHEIEAEAIRAGTLLPEDYENAGLEPPGARERLAG